MFWCIIHAAEVFMWSCWGSDLKTSVLIMQTLINTCLWYMISEVHHCTPKTWPPTKTTWLLEFQKWWIITAIKQKFCPLQCKTGTLKAVLLLQQQKKFTVFSPLLPMLFKHTTLHLVHLMTSVAHELNLIKTPKETRLNCVHAKSNTKAWRVIQLR